MNQLLLTLLSIADPGKPRSLARDHIMREAAARPAAALQSSRTSTIEAIAVAPLLEPTAFAKINTNEYPLGAFLVASVTSPAQNNTTSNIPKARRPLITVLNIIAFATFLGASLTSSDIYYY